MPVDRELRHGTLFLLDAPEIAEKQNDVLPDFWHILPRRKYLYLFCGGHTRTQILFPILYLSAEPVDHICQQLQVNLIFC